MKSEGDKCSTMYVDEGCKNYIFISYAHKDKKEVLNSIKALSSCGVNIWYDSGIEVGDDWAGKIADKLENASAVILFLSKKSAKSKNVLREIEFANAHCIPIITVQLYKFKLPGYIEKLLTVKQFTMLNSYKTYKTFANSLCPMIEKYGVISPNQPEYKDKKIHVNRHRNLVRVLLALLIFVVVVVAAVKIFVSKVPTVIGMATNPAEMRVGDAGFDCAVANGYSDEEEYGFIYEQNKSGSGIRNSTVVIYQSLGPESDLVTVPDVVGFHISEGVSKLVAAGMKTFVIDPITTKEYEIAYIAGQSITANYKVSSQNKISLSVSSAPDTEIEIYGQKIKLTDKKIEVQITGDDEVNITPLMLFGISTDYTETDPLNESRTINATSRFLISVSREDTNYYGRYRGRFVMETTISGDESFGWKMLSKSLGDSDGNIAIQIKSESFNCKAEEYNDEKYKAFVAEATGSSENVLEYNEPVMMILGRDIVLTDMSPFARNIEWLYSLTSRFVFAIPELSGDVLKQPYSIIVQKNGKVYVAFYGRDGEQKAMEFHGDIKYE